ncbi:MAG: hypothetical protein KIS85_01715 [Anaerolineales bacterium]|nr:hypothetical protein [Anaerolineales bacterium]
MAANASPRTWLAWRSAFWLLALAGWLAVVALLAVPSEAGRASLAGYSLERLALALLTALLAALFTRLTLRAGQTGWLAATLERLVGMPAGRFGWLCAALALALLASGGLALLPEARAISLFGPYALYLGRLQPLLWYAVLVTGLGLSLLLAQRYGDGEGFEAEQPTLRLGVLLFGALLAFAGLVALTGLGLDFDATIWNAPNAPILFTQVLLSIAAALLALWLVFRLKGRWAALTSPRRLELFLAALVWLVAAAVWLAQPAGPTNYSSEPRPPAYQSFPLSDAFNHDLIANSVLIGEGFRISDFVATRRPVYVQFLAGLQALVGANYPAVINLQVVVLALFPAVLFFMASRLHNPLSGLLLAGLVIFREANAILLGHVVNLSHAKLLMADLPSALALAAFGLAAIAWLRGSPRNWLGTLLLGGLLGWLVLLRSQVLTLLPFFALLALLTWGLRAGWRQVVLFGLGALLVAAPWVLRNRALMGQWAIEDAVAAGFIANRYTFTPGAFALPFLPGESEGEYYARHMQTVRDFTRQHPGYVVGFVADNYARNLILTALPMPLSLQLRDPESHVRELPYWPSWDGRLAPESYLPLAANLFLVGLGLAVAWRRAGWAGLVPLAITLGFTVNLALARVGGWRYNLPADWSSILYFALGLGQVLLWAFLLLKRSPLARQFLVGLQAPAEVTAQPRPVSPKRVTVAIFLLLLLGSSFLIIEGLSRPRYHRLSSAEAAALLQSASSSDPAAKQWLLSGVQAGELAAAYGRALHPRYYGAGEGTPDGPFYLTRQMHFERLTFYLIGPDPASLALPVGGPDAPLPASSDVVVLRCRGVEYAAAVLVLPAGEPGYILPSNNLSLSCPDS